MIRRALLVVWVAAAPLGCRKEPASPAQTVDTPQAPAGGLEVREVQLGKSIGADKQVVMPVTAFAPLDTVFVSIATGGSGRTAVLSARWSMVRDGRSEMVDSTAQTVAPG